MIQRQYNILTIKNLKKFMIILQKVLKVRCNCQWYEEGEKTTNFFLNLGKTEINNKEIDNSVKVDKELEKFILTYSWYARYLKRPIYMN